VKQQAVQSIHAVIEFTKTFQISQIHPHVVLCHVKNESSLFTIAHKLEQQNILFQFFQEPDLNNEYTAIAAGIVYGEKRKLFSKLTLFTGEKQ